MTWKADLNYFPLLMEGWQYKAAFVIQFREETDLEAGSYEGKIEHVASCEWTRFHSLEELLGFVAAILAEVRSKEQS